MRLYVADTSEEVLRAWDMGTRSVLTQCDIPKPGALNTWRGKILCAEQEDGDIWEMEADTLEILRKIPAGPGVRTLIAGLDGQTLYALAGDADSVIKLDMDTGIPQVLTRVGVQPRDIALDASGGIIAVAGGASCCVHVLHSDTLAPLATIDVDGIAVGVCFAPGTLWILYAAGQEDMRSCVARVRMGTWRVERALEMEGMPGGIIALPDEGVLVGLLDGVSMIAKHGKRVAWRIVLADALPDIATRQGAYVLWADALSSQIWIVHAASAKAQPCPIPVEEPTGILLL